MSKGILVTGGTGSIGAQLVRKLAKMNDVRVRTFIRNARKAEPLSRAGAALAIGSFEDLPSIRAAAKEIDTVVLITPAGPEAATQNSSIIKIAKESSVRKVVRISAIKASAEGPTENSRLHARADDELVASGLNYVILRPNYFMQNLFASLNAIKRESAVYAGMGDARSAMIDVRDVADCAAETAVRDEFDDQIIELSGPESVSFYDVARIISDVAGRDIRYVPVSPEAVRESMLRAGLDDWIATLMRDYAKAYSEGWGDVVTDGVRRITTRPPRSSERFVREVLAPALA